MDKFENDFEMQEEYDFSNGARGVFANWQEKIKKDGKYYTRAFNYENGTVEITEIEAATHRVLSSITVSLDEMSQVCVLEESSDYRRELI